MLLLEVGGFEEETGANTAAEFFGRRHENVHVANASKTPVPAGSGPSTSGGHSQSATPSWRARNVVAAAPASQPQLKGDNLTQEAGCSNNQRTPA